MKLLHAFNNLVLAKRLVIVMLTVGLLPLLLVSVLNIILASNTLYHAKIDLLDNLRISKTGQIEEYFDLMSTQVGVLAESKNVLEAMRDFSSSMDSLAQHTILNEFVAGNKKIDIKKDLESYYKQEFAEHYKIENSGKSPRTEELLPQQDNSIVAQYLYISNNPYALGSKDDLIYARDGSQYSKFHMQYHLRLKRYVEKFHFYDMFLIEPVNGKIVYSVYKEIDFATSLKDGPYHQTNLSLVFKKALSLQPDDQAVVIDFKRYLPSYDKPASFIASPIYDGIKLIGVLAFQVPISIMNDILHNTKGMGSTGEVYLVGEEGLMRSQSRFDPDNTVLKTAVDTQSAKRLFAGESGSVSALNYRAREVISSYAKLSISGLNWGIIADIEKSEALSSVYTSIALNLGLAALAVVLVIAVAIRFSRGVSAPLNEAVAIAESVSMGILDHKITPLTQCEVGNLLRSLAKMQQNLELRRLTDKRALAENTRIKQALDHISSNMLVVDIEGKIVYCNVAMNKFLAAAELQIKTKNKNFNPDQVVGNLTLLELIPHESSTAEKLIKSISTMTEEISIQGISLTLIANPVLNNESKRLGTVIEWKDRTVELSTEKEVQSVVDSALAGDLSQRINMAGKSGYFAHLSESVNSLVSVSEQVTKETLRVIEAMANGQLGQKIETDYQGIYNQLKLNVNATSDKLNEVVKQIQQSARLVKAGASKIALANLDLNKRTEFQSTNLQDSAFSMGLITEKVSESAKFSVQASDIFQNTRVFAKQGGEAVDSTLQAMIEIERSSKKITEVVGVIDSIAFQINLLALNAAVEAARVGEEGRGFNVVASEVRALATISAKSAKEITASIKISNENVKEGMRLALDSGEKLADILSSINEAAGFVEEIASLNAEQFESVSQINKSINQMDQIAIENSAIVEHASKASDQLGEQALNLEKMINFFSADEIRDKLKAKS
ncbi:MAG: hypothetical protein HRU06_06140 [Oceanospirillaceae bacterium]|nr:hypothetical protein [Oceanospirillaceae bacterium]